MVGQISRKNILNISWIGFLFLCDWCCQFVRGFADFPFQSSEESQQVRMILSRHREKSWNQAHPIFQYCFIGSAMKAARLFSLIEGFGWRKCYGIHCSIKEGFGSCLGWNLHLVCENYPLLVWASPDQEIGGFTGNNDNRIEISKICRKDDDRRVLIYDECQYSFQTS